MINNEIKNNLFDDILGQEIAISLLISALEKNYIAPAYLYVGSKGIGKKLTAKRFLEGLLSLGNSNNRHRIQIEAINHPDLIWIEPTFINEGKLITKSEADKIQLKKKSIPIIRLEQIKRIKEFVGRKPIAARFSMVVIEDVDYINESASNALLKTLEEPENGVFILISERPEKLLKTIHSRCQIIPFKRLGSIDMRRVLEKLENEKQSTNENISRDVLLNFSNGSPGSFIKNLEIVCQLPTEILEKSLNLSTHDLERLSLAKDIAEKLSFEEQIWLIKFLQHKYWLNNQNKEELLKFENLYKYINSYIQPRLAWEVTLLSL
tara:strand:+ start:883 stop:1848 length:966 start_codon:yes stop_codon:yes gene_type:complete